MKIGIVQTNNIIKSNFKANQNTHDEQKVKIETEFNDFIDNLFEVARKNGLSESEIYKQIQQAYNHRRTELGKLDILS